MTCRGKGEEGVGVVVVAVGRGDRVGVGGHNNSGTTARMMWFIAKPAPKSWIGVKYPSFRPNLASTSNAKCEAFL